jgi:hypothetical protein
LLQKQVLNINFVQGLDTKTDPFQVSPGKFLSLSNSIFTKGGLLQKRNGFGQLSSLPDTTYTNTATFNGNLTAIGVDIAAYSEGSATWINKGLLQSCAISVLPLVKSSTNQTQCDAVIASNGQVCTVFSDYNGSTTTYKYVIADSVTGQIIVPATLIMPSAGTIVGPPRVFWLVDYFIIVFGALITGINHLEYVAIRLNMPTVVTTAVSISNSYNPSGNPAFDGYVANGNLYLAWNGNDGGGAIRVAYLKSSLLLSGTAVFSGHNGTLFSVTADETGSSPVIWVTFYSSGSSTGYTLAVNQILATVLGPTEIISSGTVENLATVAQNMLMTVYYEIQNFYGYDGSIPTNYVERNTVTQGGTVGTPAVLIRSVGLASKAFIINGEPYVNVTYYSVYQPTYFTINDSGQIITKFAYSNAGGYLTDGLPSALVSGNSVSIAYLYKDLLTAVNKTQGIANSAGIYSQTGVNLITITIDNSNIHTSEIGLNLNVTGGILWAYDGSVATEQNFNVWPDNVEVTTATGSGDITAQQYYYQATYEWTDAQGNLFRSAPSIPVAITTTTSSSTNTIYVPSLRLTYKIATPVRIVLYRWSTAQQNYYQVTSVIQPVLNPNILTTDYVTITDTLSDAEILGNELIYTTGGVIEDIAPPPSSSIALFDNRLFLVDAEDKNLLWFSKQIIEGTPVEMSDLFTLYVSPTISAQGSTGPITALSTMDDKLIIFKKDAIYYMNGTGPDNTGANSQYSQPTFITSTVGCANENSIVFIPQGLMFQSDKGIWILGRDLSTNYIGAPVEQFNGDLVESALGILGTNQVRFTLNSGITLMYDYFYGQWGTFNGVPAISSVLYQGLHTFIDQYGRVFQETPGVYLDGSNPVLLSFTTSWFNLAGLQGYLRAYFFYLLGVYYSPHKLNLQIAYNYNSSPTQNSIITPSNFSPNYGEVSPYGQQSEYGSNNNQANIEQWRVFLQKQRCQSFQITLTEVYDSTMGGAAGQGLSLSGLALVYAGKKGFRPMANAQSVG